MDKGRRLEDLPVAMDDRDEWREEVIRLYFKISENFIRLILWDKVVHYY